MPPARLVLQESDIGSVGQNQFTVRILTDGSAPPLVTLDTNIGYPAVRDYYATARLVNVGGIPRGHVELTVRFENPVPVGASKLAVTVYQSDAKGYTFP